MTNIDWTKPIEFFDEVSWIPARMLCTDGPSNEYPVAIQPIDHNIPTTVAMDGRWTFSTGIRCRNAMLIQFNGKTVDL